MNMQQFFEQFRNYEQYRDTGSALNDKFGSRNVPPDPFHGLSYMADEMREAADMIAGLTVDIQYARLNRKMGAIHENTAALVSKVSQLLVMAESLQKVTAEHKARGCP